MSRGKLVLPLRKDDEDFIKEVIFGPKSGFSNVIIVDNDLSPIEKLQLLAIKNLDIIEIEFKHKTSLRIQKWFFIFEKFNSIINHVEL